MINSLKEKPESTKKALSIIGALIVTGVLGAVWVVTFDKQPLAQGAEQARESFKQLGAGVQNQIDIYKTQTGGQDLESPGRYQATDEELPSDELTQDSSFGPDDSGVVQAEQGQGEVTETEVEPVADPDSTDSQTVEQTIY